MITRYLPTFKQLEPNLLYGLQSGHIIAQSPVAYDSVTGYGVATVDKNGYKFIENGVFCTLSADGKVVNYEGTGKAFIHFTEELNTFLEGRKYFAVECEKEETYPRLIGTYVGDTFTTDNFVEGQAGAGYTAVSSSNKAKYAVVVDGILNLYHAVPSDVELVYAVKESTLPNGEDAYEFLCVKCS